MVENIHAIQKGHEGTQFSESATPTENGFDLDGVRLPTTVERIAGTPDLLYVKSETVFLIGLGGDNNYRRQEAHGDGLRIQALRLIGDFLYVAFHEPDPREGSKDRTLNYYLPLPAQSAYSQNSMVGENVSSG